MPRTRKPGAASNRTDLATPKVPTGLRYGEASQLAGAQSQVPVAQGPDFERLNAMASAHPTDHVVGLDQPTQRPNEPITAGMPTGPGPGMDFAMARNDPTADMVTRLEAFFQRWPTPEMSSLLAEARRSGA